MHEHVGTCYKTYNLIKRRKRTDQNSRFIAHIMWRVARSIVKRAPSDITNFRRMAMPTAQAVGGPGRREGRGSTVLDWEIDHFSELSGSWWAADGPQRTLNLMNSARLEFMYKQLVSQTGVSNFDWLRGRKVLDVGCGVGILSECLARLGAEVTAIDASPAAIRAACLHKPSVDNEWKLEYQNTTTDQLLSRPDHPKYDVITAFEIIEHTSNPHVFAEHLQNLLAPGGAIFLSTISKTALSYLVHVVAAEYVLRLVPPGTHNWSQFITPDELESMFAGWKTFSQGVIFNPIVGRWELQSPDNAASQAGNYLMYITK